MTRLAFWVDASADHGGTFPFPLGAGRVIKGWDEGVATMRVGGKRKLIVPPALGYGAQGAGGVIPPGATRRCAAANVTPRPGFAPRARRAHSRTQTGRAR
ncbi:MAG: FKBP-type peptidyl-prolyl cis-trans isomerase [Candidatus Eremiobacteraeota bacterium]|nr:FKBP-type peptidyl-prolyl cis-trans isomerase [Candidatus Eremiobacteraeota bacterium]MBC5802259.1 FKBP-type peptidyl-prolyl cis-trans isomerase [Candidatus Eremiobacteraeota bacterium]MBC5822772.1 FKBP-type peptidyl-prolyl cis-trans isomerase [Candidatus Eremiobacteraeota bacterium]